MLILVAALMAQAEAAPEPDPEPNEQPTALPALPRVDNELPPAPGPLFAEAAVRMAYRLPPASNTAGPAVGIGFGLMLGARYALVAQRLELALAVDFAHAQHGKDVEGVRTLPSGVLEAFDGRQVVSQNTFGALHIATALFMTMRPWVGLGGGLSVGFFESDLPAFRPGAVRSYTPYAHLAAGVNVPLTTPFYVDLRLDYHVLLSDPVFTPQDGMGQQVLGDLVSVGAAFGTRFP